jgi:uncharacterized membrane protein required for colicin V production
MNFSWFDMLLIVSAFGFVWGGFFGGLIQAIGGVVGALVGEIIASRYYGTFADLIAPLFNGNEILAKVVAFVLLFLLVARLVGAIFWFVNKIFHFIAIIPGLKLLNKLGGAVFGFIEASFFIGITLQFIVRLPITAGFAEALSNSQVANYFLAVTGWLVPLFPKIIKSAQDATKTVLPENINVNVNSVTNTIKNITN